MVLLSNCFIVKKLVGQFVERKRPAEHIRNNNEKNPRYRQHRQIGPELTPALRQRYGVDMVVAAGHQTRPGESLLASGPYLSFHSRVMTAEEQTVHLFGAGPGAIRFISVYSEPEKGTTFKIYLPRQADEADLPDVHREKELPAGCGETVLLVEDEVALLALTRRILTELDYAVLEAATPGQALALAREHAGRIDLLLTDVVMPEMNGRDLAGRLLVTSPELKVLYMSGYTANVIAHHGVLEAGVHFIPKPFTKRELAGKVREILGP
jgi:CheY-like chemotaxis protein